MSEDFSFYEFFRTCLRFWYIFVVTTVLAIISFLGAVSLKTFYSYCVYDGVIRVASIDSFIGTGFEGDELLRFYNTISSRAEKVMMDDEIKFDVYEEFEPKLYQNKKAEKNKEDFFQNLKVTGGDGSVKISFSFPLSSDEDKRVIEDVVISYVRRATLRAVADSRYLSGKLSSSVYENLDTKKLNSQNMGSNVQGIIISAAVAVVLSVGVVAIIFFVDKRLKSKRGLALPCEVMADALSEESLTKLDAFSQKQDSRVVGIVGVRFNTKEFAFSLAKSIVKSGRKALIANIGEDSEDKVQEADGVDVLCYKTLQEAITCKSAIKDSSYDKVLVCSNVAINATDEVLASICDSFIVIINQAVSVKKEITHTIDCLGEDKILISVITNTIPSFIV